jgi:type IV pilus assembly protein PilZ
MLINSTGSPALSDPGRASSLLSLSVRDRAALRSAYMPFVEGGGLFVPTARTAEIGDDVYLIMTLPDDPTRYAVPGRVVWITPSASGSRQQGLGIQFARTEAGEQIRAQIEALIAGMPRSTAATHTF